MMNAGPGPQIDDAIVFEDDAIVMDDDAIVIDDTTQDDHKLTVAEKKVLESSERDPLWKDDRVRFSKEHLLNGYKKADEIDFTLLVEDYMEMFDVFNQ